MSTEKTVDTIVASGININKVGSLDAYVHLENPHWAYYAAQQLGIDKPYEVLPQQYAHWLSRYKRSACR